MIEPGKRYAHYKKGTIYIVLGVGRLEREGMEGEEYVIYQAPSTDEGEPGFIWIRGRNEFESEVEWNGRKVPRFAPTE